MIMEELIVKRKNQTEREKHDNYLIMKYINEETGGPYYSYESFLRDTKGTEDDLLFAKITNLTTRQVEEIKNYMSTFVDNDLTKKIEKKKMGRNDKCTCNSGKKYKNCCLNRVPLKTTWVIDPLTQCFEYLMQAYPKMFLINISNQLRLDGNEQYIQKGREGRTIMIAEKNELNNWVFEKKDYSDKDIMIVFNEKFYAYNKNDFDETKRSITELLSS